MAIPVQKVELGVDAQSSIAPFFALDSNLRGALDNVTYVLAGDESIYYDITPYVRSYQISRGRNFSFQSFTAGQANVELNNHDRTFDPLYLESPLAGQIVPRRELRITSGSVVQYTGWIDDWNLTYTVNGDSIADATALDAFSILANQNVSAGTPVQQLSGERINTYLSDPNVNWSLAQRNIAAGLYEMGTQEIEADENALNYLQKVAQSEQGLLFIGKEGNVTFKEFLRPFNVGAVTDFNDTDGIPFTSVAVSFGSEELFNQVTIANVGGGTVTVSDLDSQGAYGIRNFTATDLLGATDQQSIDIASNIAAQFSLPEYRIAALEVALHGISEEEVQEVLALEIGDVARIQWTPNNVGPSIAQYAEIVQITHAVQPETHFVEFSFRKLYQAVLFLDDPIFGTLDTGNVLGAPFNDWTLSDVIYGRLSAGMALQ
jgi:hypothetical protein